jgi:hypothetical protein
MKVGIRKLQGSGFVKIDVLGQLKHEHCQNDQMATQIQNIIKFST